ncbi:hypothetical protein UFOVP1616_39 [uncultured Caudovirales phage]|uniref:Terminase small subunit n=1 Tax=uncultured Caudovirales phage TaxID=2100421 RepID=A0A6J5SKE2_9CAUD|nr:hypothetical protein UFOVP1467_55 [uncultured Caudovirales phage]CAB4219658.1 hypothetical protein UFOVP1616_39 [uncultured Caudovirales phage]
MGGVAPKPASERRRKNKDIFPHTTVKKHGGTFGPELPARPAGDDWHPQTLAWWQTWRTSPLAEKMEETDWDFLLDTALLHTAFWNGSNKVAGELRLRVAKFGATLEDRLKLRIDAVEGAAAETTKPKTVSKSRRDSILSLVETPKTG